MNGTLSGSFKCTPKTRIVPVAGKRRQHHPFVVLASQMDERSPRPPFSSLMPLLPLLLAAALLAGPVDRVLLRSGQSIAVAGEVRQQGEKLLFRSPAGVLYSISMDEIDFEAMARGTAKQDSVEEIDRDARHPARRLNVTPEERDRLLAELSKKKGTPRAPEVLSPELRRPEPPQSDRESSREAEERWRAEARAAREAIQDRKAELESLRQRSVDLEDQLRMLLSSGYDPNTLSAQTLDLGNTRSRIDGAQEALRDAQRALTELQERARRAGVLPGWLRD